MSNDPQKKEGCLALIYFLFLIILFGIFTGISIITAYFGLQMILTSFSKTISDMTIQSGFTPIYLLIIAALSGFSANVIRITLDELAKK